MWDPDTRSIQYSRKKVAERLRYWAQRYIERAKHTDKAYGTSLLDLAEKIELRVHSPYYGAKECIFAADDFEEQSR